MHFPASLNSDAPHQLDRAMPEGEAGPVPDDAALSDRSPRDHGRNLSSLALVYLRHNDPSRAMVLGIAAMSMGDLSPATILLVGEAMLSAGDPEQALAVLSRFEREGGLDSLPSPAEQAARHYLAARVLHRQGDAPEARKELFLARDIFATVPPTTPEDSP